METMNKKFGPSYILGIDGRKMSKSNNNTIPIFATEEETRKLVMSIPTSSAGIDEPKDPEQDIVFQLHKIMCHQIFQNKVQKFYNQYGVTEELRNGLAKLGYKLVVQTSFK